MVALWRGCNVIGCMEDWQRFTHSPLCIHCNVDVLFYKSFSFFVFLFFLHHVTPHRCGLERVMHNGRCMDTGQVSFALTTTWKMSVNVYLR